MTEFVKTFLVVWYKLQQLHVVFPVFVQSRLTLRLDLGWHVMTSSTAGKRKKVKRKTSCNLFPFTFVQTSKAKKWLQWCGWNEPEFPFKDVTVAFFVSYRWAVSKHPSLFWTSIDITYRRCKNCGRGFGAVGSFGKFYQKKVWIWNFFNQNPENEIPNDHTHPYHHFFFSVTLILFCNE